MPVTLETRREDLYRSLVLMLVSGASDCTGTEEEGIEVLATDVKAMTSKPRAALPARSPMPLMVHSSWRAPALPLPEVRNGKTQIVVTRTETTGAVDIGNVGFNASNVIAELGRGEVADGIWNVQRGCT